MKKSHASSQNMGSFPSPGAPNYRDKSLVNQKGWSSERVSKPAISIRRHASVAGLTTFNSGRTMPSKWDEAERWICSPVSAYGYTDAKISHGQLQRRPNSISGPIVPPGIAYCTNYSATVPLRQGLAVKNLMVGSPFSTGVLVPDAVSVHHYDPHDTVFGPCYDIGSGTQYASAVLNETGLAPPSISGTPMCSELLCDPSSPISQDEKHDGTKNEDTLITNSSKRDKGTQMSPQETDNDAHSSPKSSASSAMDQQNCHSPKLEVRDVLVDSEAIAIKWSKRHATKLTKKDSQRSKDFSESSTEAQASSWDMTESTLDISKLQREEAKITAWENLQKAKAEAAIRKLEMKLEKKRSSSMDKIINKLRRAHTKAENMRSSIPLQQGHQVPKTCKVFSFPKYAQVWSPSSCFSTRAPSP